MSAAATRAWYLPTCVKSAMPVTSPIAQTFAAARSRSSTSMPFCPTDTPTRWSPRSSVSGRRPVATSRRSAWTRDPSESVSSTPCAGRDHEPVVRELLAVDLDDARTGDARASAHERAALLREPVELRRVVPVARDPVAPGPDAVRHRPLGDETGGAVE